ncbi:MAG: hypothetical protein HZA93_03280 [Verrucomicrobia bacterium]|nr:hypothetical protein [Verrucomicrobiota bacterium]
MQISGSNSPYQTRFLVNHDSGSPVRVSVGASSQPMVQPQSEAPTNQHWNYLAASIGCDRVATALETTPDL